MYPGVAKAWHIHKNQIDWWYVPIGNLKLVMFDKRADSPTRGELQTIFMGENYPAKAVKIPAGVAHGCRVLGGGVTHLFYVTSGVMIRRRRAASRMMTRASAMIGPPGRKSNKARELAH